MDILSYIITTTFLYFILTIPIGVFFVYFKIGNEELGGIVIENHSFFGLFFLTVIFTPILETLIAQVLPIELINRFFPNKNNLIPILISAFLFAVMHFAYSIWYSLVIFPLGLLLANTYVIFKKRKESSFWVTAAIHSLRNLIGIIIIFFFE
ncbi:MAG: CPBP family intramembrane metalloprotease [Bacteroidetes bacterium]|nr:CPBP family intramembrane metalloprotease [Bacteroidota bacterium]